MAIGGVGSRKRIAIFSTNNYIWSFPTWLKTIPKLQESHDVVGIHLFPHKLAKREGFKIALWYMQVFGIYEFVLLTIYAIKTRFLQLISKIRSWSQLASFYDISLYKRQTPNSKAVYNWVKENNIDIIFIMVGDILKEEIINAPAIGIINKHAAILPSCRGIFPFFWSRLNNCPVGITFYRVDTGIDTGSILLQRKYAFRCKKDIFEMSILRFHIDVFSMYPDMAVMAVERLINNQYVQPCLSVKDSYNTFPTKEDYRIYRKKSYRGAKFSDLFYKPK